MASKPRANPAGQNEPRAKPKVDTSNDVKSSAADFYAAKREAADKSIEDWEKNNPVKDE